MSTTITPIERCAPALAPRIKELYAKVSAVTPAPKSWDNITKQRRDILQAQGIEAFAGAFKTVIPLTKNWVVKICPPGREGCLDNEMAIIDNLPEYDKCWFPKTFRLSEDMVLQERFDVNSKLYFADWAWPTDGPCIWYELARALGISGDVHEGNIGFRENGEPVFIDFFVTERGSYFSAPSPVSDPGPSSGCPCGCRG